VELREKNKELVSLMSLWKQEIKETNAKELILF
jgi:hypothetical protein